MRPISIPLLIQRQGQRLALALAMLFLVACGGSDPGGGERIREFAQGMRWAPGFVPFYHDTAKGRVYLLLDDRNTELLYQGSLPRGVGSNDIGLDRGQLGDRAALVRFEPAGDRVLLRKVNLAYRADTENAAEQRSVEQAFASSVLWGFPVVARDGEQRLVDATEFLLRDSHGVARRLKAMNEGKFKVDASRSAVHGPMTKAFERNTELEALITLVGEDPGPQLRSVVPDPHAITVHMRHSFIALPEPGYAPRAFHPESGFWPMVFADYATAVHEPLRRRFIPRHRLVKKNPDETISDPVEPIVYYLDPGTPEPVRSALLDGARWWADAFLAAGFSNAFRVEMLPEDADPMDLRYNVIQWVHRSTRGWSYGSSVVDPRTGEILKGHVTLGSLRVRQDLLIARGMTTPLDADNDEQAQAMALARIRQLAAHEVGHTLGLAHNFAASVNNLASVMDYPHPRLSLDEGGAVTLSGAYGEGIGEWDKRAIRYGYAQYRDPWEEAPALRALVADNRAAGFEFMSDPDSRSLRDFHPRSHLWDNGADPVTELERVMAVRAAALERFGAGSLRGDAPLSDLQEAIVPVYLFHRYQAEAVGKLIGGADYRYALASDHEEAAVMDVPAPQQQRAIEALLATLDPSALALSPQLLAQIPPKAYGYDRNRESAPARTGALFDPLTLAEVAVGHTLTILLHPERLARMALQHDRDASQADPLALFARLQDRILLPEYDGVRGAIDRRSASLLLRHWRQLYADDSAAPEVRAAAQQALERSQRMMAARSRGEPAYAAFYRFESTLIDQALQGRVVPRESQPATLPPGSPIGAPH